MKTLYLVRHAKSSWKHDVEDYQLPLKERGLKDVQIVSQKVKTEIEPPQRIISSAAVRVLSTAQFFKEALAVSDSDFETNHELYDFRDRKSTRMNSSHVR